MKHLPMPPLEKLKKYLQYNPSTGEMIWINLKSKRNKIGTKAGVLKKDNSLHIRFDGKDYLLHRIAYFMHTGIDPEYNLIDHKDNNRSNNKFDNLRIASNSNNQWNRNANKTNKNGYKGVDYHNGLYRARIAINGKQILLGYYNSAIRAAHAYRQAAKELHGEFAKF